MSSFLMNSTPYAEPKFPPSEEYSEYSHTNYIQNHCQSEDSYYRSHIQTSYGYGTGERRYGPPLDSYGGASGGGNFQGYGNPCLNGTTPMTRLPIENGLVNITPAHQSPHQPPHSDSPGSVPSPGPPPSVGSLGSPTSAQTTNNNQTTASTPPTIYPWMKRVHCNSGKTSS